MARITHVDVNGDGCEDFAMSDAATTGSAAPSVYLRNGKRFEPVTIRGLPARALALELNGDGRVDFAAVTDDEIVTFIYANPDRLLRRFSPSVSGVQHLILPD